MKSFQAPASRRFFQKKDLWVLLLILFLAGAGFFFFRAAPQKGSVEALILLDGEEALRLPLRPGDAHTFSLPGEEQVRFRIYEDGSIAFEASDCPDQICVHTGRLWRAGDFAACLPNRLLVKIVSSGSSEEESPDLIL